ncbi:copper transporter [Stackebrandtia nassauensis]|uniref:Copper transporter n=1 Tax=Stackebrandtia nassauensis (strain DSM 44728 / CIP 108903 / NRRL B-16338 / NBRC 102104 / LLR-40K-21) TaxID=446470 RepID=D3Q531_STANL|nr:copper transporter [Stackebrandtia nassauensis]ADD44080.1 hypothetical protein Snas_4435 [Stackebrandtia nassauensis DSM 44728]
MINHRFHLVAVVAIFLAVAVGLGLGMVGVGGSAGSAHAEAEQADTQRLRAEVDRLGTASEKARDFATGVAPVTLAELLADERVLLVGIGGAKDAELDAISDTLEYSRATSAGTLNFTDAFTDPDNSASLIDLAAKLTPKGVKPPNDNNGVETVSALLAMSILDKSEVSASERDRLVSALEGLKMVDVAENLSDERATAVVIVSGKPESGHQPSVVTASDRFGREGATVLAAAKPDGVIEAVREDPARSKRISTVDNVDSPQGRVTAALALPSTIEGETGHYGTGESANAVVPVPS